MKKTLSFMDVKSKSPRCAGLGAFQASARTIRITLLWIAAVCATVLPAHASFEDLGTGARASGLGGAFTPLADDIYAIYYNPAGLVYLRRKEFSASYGLLHAGLGDKSKISNSFIAYGQPLAEKYGTLGLSWQQLSLDGLYGERTIALGYGRRLSQNWAAGVNMKQLYRDFTAPSGQTNNFGVVTSDKIDPVFVSGNSRSNYAADFGLLYRPYRNYSYGLALQNVNEPNMALAGNDSDIVPMTARLGLAYNERALTLAGELDTKKTAGGDRDYDFTAAAEKWWLGAGFSQGDLAMRGSLAFGSRSYSQFTLGVSYRLDAVQLDYGFLMPMGGITFGESQGTHRLSFTLRFGRVIAEPDYEIRMRNAEIAARKAEEELDDARKEAENLARQLEKLKSESEVRRAAGEQMHKKTGGGEGPSKELAVRYAEAMDAYWKRKSAGASLNERIGFLTQIVREYRGTGLDVSVAEKELAIAKSDQAKAEMDLAVSWNYYQKIVARGASVPERIQLLSRMIERFARTGVDMSNLRSELKSLQGNNR